MIDGEELIEIREDSNDELEIMLEIILRKSEKEKEKRYGTEKRGNDSKQ